MSTNNSENTRLKELGTSRFEVAQNESDIRGWIIKNSQGRVLGKVSDLLFDTESEKVLYMVMDMVGNEMHLKERKVMLPLEHADLQEAYKHVVFSGVMANELTELPTYEKGKVSKTVEELVYRVFHSDTSGEKNYANQPLLQNEVGTAPLLNSLSQQTDRSRPQIVVGVFDNNESAHAALDYLLANNVKRNEIDVSSKDYNEQSGLPNQDDTGLTNWFKSIFGNDDDAKKYSNAAKTGTVLTIQTNSMDDAERVARMLDNSGAIKLQDSTTNTERAFQSRILDRKAANKRWD